MSPTPDPHWTAYLTALLTPVVAAIAVYIAFINARTARNKLKLDLFERRMKVRAMILQTIKLTFEYDELPEGMYGDLTKAINDAEWIFDSKVYEHLTRKTLPLYDEYAFAVSKIKNVNFLVRNNSISAEEGNEKLRALRQNRDNSMHALADDEIKMMRLMAPFLRLSH